MQPLMDSKAFKKPTNLSINKDLLAKARNLNINLSATLEEALMDKIRHAKRKQWRENNQKALRSCNELAEKNGLFSDSHRVL